MTKVLSLVIFWPVLVGDAATISRCAWEGTKILCGVIDDDVAGRFDSLVFDYFKANHLGYGYLNELGSFQPTLKILDESTSSRRKALNSAMVFIAFLGRLNLSQS